MRDTAISKVELLSELRRIRPEVFSEEYDYDKGAFDLWQLVYATVKKFPAKKEIQNEGNTD